VDVNEHKWFYLGVVVNESYMNLYEFIIMATTRSTGRSKPCIFLLFILIFHSFSQPLASAAPYNEVGYIKRHIGPLVSHYRRSFFCHAEIELRIKSATVSAEPS
jgi:hypothetical protein